MSSTRKAEPGSKFRQERYASSPEHDRGLIANLVGQRATALSRPEDRELVWFIQMLSHREGLQTLAATLLAKYPERNTTLAMRKYGMKPGQVYSAKEVKAIRAEMPNGDDAFLLRGELSGMETLGLPRVPDRTDDPLGAETEHAMFKHTKAEDMAASRPSQYPAEEFVAECRKAAEELPRYLATLCLDPSLRFDGPGPWYFPDLVQTLRDFMAEWVEERRREIQFTSLGKKVCNTMEYALSERCMVIVHGRERLGKTHSAKAWCDQHPGSARYVQVPSTEDEIGFYRAIAKGIGVSVNLNSKAQELRQRIEDVLQRGHLLLCLDEAHYLFPSRIDTRKLLPARLCWLMTALVNYEVPLCLVTTQQFFESLNAVVKRTGWASGQFEGRVGHLENLPDALTNDDLALVARAMLPSGDATCIKMLLLYAQSSAKYVAGIEMVVKRARFLAKGAGRANVLAIDVKRAISDSVSPSDSALASALAKNRRASGRVRQALPIPARGDAEAQANTCRTAVPSLSPLRREITPPGLEVEIHGRLEPAGV